MSRYYGQSKPWPGKKLRRHMGYLTAEQALAGRVDNECRAEHRNVCGVVLSVVQFEDEDDNKTALFFHTFV